MEKQSLPRVNDSMAKILGVLSELDSPEIATRMRRAATLFRWPELLAPEPQVATTGSLAWLSV